MSDLTRYQPLIDQLMAKDPNERFADAGALLDEIGKIEAEEDLGRPAGDTRVTSQNAMFESQAKNGKTNRGSILELRYVLFAVLGFALGGPLVGVCMVLLFFLAKKYRIISSELKWVLGGVLLAVCVVLALYVGVLKKPASPIKGWGYISQPDQQTPDRQKEPQNRPVSNDSSPPSTTISPEAARRAKIAKLLTEAERDIAADRLTEPAKTNALEKYRRILVLEPGNTQAQMGLANIVSRYIGMIDAEIQKKNIGKAETYLTKAQGILPDSTEIRAARERLETEKRQGFDRYMDQGPKAIAEQDKAKVTVSIATLPTMVNLDAKTEPYLVTLTLQCAAKPQQLENFNYPDSLDFIWEPLTCGDVLLEIVFRETTLRQIWSGEWGFRNFLGTFRNGSNTFVPEDFPQQKSILDGLGITYIQVNYIIRGGEPVLAIED